MARKKPADQVRPPQRYELPPIPIGLGELTGTEALVPVDMSTALRPPMDPVPVADVEALPIEVPELPDPVEGLALCSHPREAPAAGDGTTQGAVLFTPAGVPSRDRRRQRAAAEEVGRTAKRAAAEAVRAERESQREEHRQAAYLPKGGEPGPRALRSYRPVRVKPHRATSEVLSGAYPFLAEAGLGSDGVLIGHDSWSGAAFVYDPWELYAQGVLTNPNMLLAGVVGRGKSCLSKALATRSIAFGKKVYVPGDPKGEWTAVSRAVGGQAIELGGSLEARLNPLDEGPRAASMSDTEWVEETRKRRRSLLGSLTASSLGRGLDPTEHTALDVALEVATSGNDVPILPMVVDALLAPDRGAAGSTVEQLAADGREAGHALGRMVHGDLSGLFDGPSTVRFDPWLPMVSLDLSRISGSDALIGMVMTCASAWMEAALADPTAGRRWVIYDEAWRLLRQPALLARMQSQWKLSRALGIANLMVIHRLSDLDAVGEADSEARNLALGLLADCSTKIIYAQERGEGGKTGATLGLSSTEIDQLPDLARGEGLWRIGERSFVVRHLCTPGELELFNTNQRMLDGV